MPIEKWIDFYEQSFPNREAATSFVEELEGITDRAIPRHRAKIMMHQAQRLISLSDDIIRVREGRESLQLLFVLICAESVAKLFHNFDDEGQSRAFVRRFFSEFVVGEDRTILENRFFTHDATALTLQAVADCLYSVRCDVVHEGQYWGFHFHDGDTPMLNTDPDVTVHITFTEFRAIIIRGCVRAIQAYAAPRRTI
ncbi:MAG: hypothetical protein HZB95_12170 [Nitrosomonadales bacterium]|nr:hypothetical protein [Nitrosomonadales bacterium]